MVWSGQQSTEKPCRTGNGYAETTERCYVAVSKSIRYFHSGTKSSRPLTQTTKPAAGEEKALEMRAKLFSRTNAGWAKRGTGTLRLCCTFSGRRSVKLLGENGSVLLDVDVENMMLVSKLIKESAKGNCAYVRFTAEFSAEKGREVFLIQVKPDLLNTLYSSLTGASRGVNR